MKKLLINGNAIFVDDTDFVRVSSQIIAIKNSCYKQYAYIRKGSQMVQTLAAFILETNKRLYYKDGNPLNNCRSNLSFTRFSIKRSHPKLKQIELPPRQIVRYHPLEALIVGTGKDYGVPIVFP